MDIPFPRMGNERAARTVHSFGAMLVRDYFDATLDDWDSVYRRPTLFSSIYRRRLQAALESVDALASSTARRAALDIGCGPGLGTTALARRGYTVDAVDTSAGMIDRALARAVREGVAARIHGRVADVHALPFDDARFDLVFIVGVIEWLPSLDRPLSEIARVLAPGGHLVLTADNSWALSCLVDPLQHPLIVPLKRALGRLTRLVHPTRRPLRTYARSAGALKDAIDRAGLTPLRHATLGFGPFTLLNRQLVPDGVGHTIDAELTALARRVAPLRDAGLVHLSVAQKA